MKVCVKEFSLYKAAVNDVEAGGGEVLADNF